METFEEFSSYYKNGFWKRFNQNKHLFVVPRTTNDRKALLQEVYTEIATKKYFPQVPKFYLDIDKGHCVTRIVPIFEFKDYVVYYYCIKRLESKIAINRVENTFGGWTLGGLLRRSEEDEMTRRKKYYDGYEDFEADMNGVSVSEYSFNPKGWKCSYLPLL